MICVSIGNIAFETALEIAGRAEMIEIRADLCSYTDDQYITLLTLSNRSIFTVRPGEQDENERLRLLQLACSHSASFIDAEIESSADYMRRVKEMCQRSDTGLIISYHNYSETPEAGTLVEIMHECYRKGAAVAKIATMVNQPADLSNLFSLYREKGRKVVLGMGEAGIMSRIAAIPLGSEFTFASPEGEGATAPGQLSEKELKDVYKILKIQ